MKEVDCVQNEKWEFEKEVYFHTDQSLHKAGVVVQKVYGMRVV